MVRSSWASYNAPSFSRSTHKNRRGRDKKSSSNILITDVLHHSAERIRSDEAEKATKEEIENLVSRGTWEMNLEEDFPEDAKVISGSFAITIKDIKTGDHNSKARFVADGHKDSEKSQLIRKSTTARQSSVRILAALVAIV